MSRESRAKQFMPFAALKGYQEALAQKEKVVVEKIDFSQEYAEELDRKLQCITQRDIVTVVYYCNGQYCKITGMVSKLDPENRFLKVVNTKIALSDLYDIKKE